MQVESQQGGDAIAMPIYADPQGLKVVFREKERCLAPGFQCATDQSRRGTCHVAIV